MLIQKVSVKAVLTDACQSEFFTKSLRYTLRALRALHFLLKKALKKKDSNDCDIFPNKKKNRGV